MRPRGKKARFPKPLAAPELSSRVYVRLDPAHVAMFRFLLEAEDNLAYISTVDRWACVLKTVFSPHQRKAVLEYLDTMRALVPFTLVCGPRDPELPDARTARGACAGAPPGNRGHGQNSAKDSSEISRLTAAP